MELTPDEFFTWCLWTKVHRLVFKSNRLSFTEKMPQVLESEQGVEYPGSYCGTLDIRLVIDGKEGILDIKGQPSANDRLQLAGYACTFPRPMKRWNLYLRVGKTYRLVEHPNHRQDDEERNIVQEGHEPENHAVTTKA